jgi:hypothetical protein
MGVRKDKFHVNRLRAYTRAKCQAAFRYEDWELTYADWCDFWPNEQIWAMRGRMGDSLCLTRRDLDKPWSRSNCCLLPRTNIIAITNRRNTSLPTEQFWTEAIYLD